MARRRSERYKAVADNDDEMNVEGTLLPSPTFLSLPSPEEADANSIENTDETGSGPSDVHKQGQSTQAS